MYGFFFMLKSNPKSKPTKPGSRIWKETKGVYMSEIMVANKILQLKP